MGRLLYSAAPSVRTGRPPESHPIKFVQNALEPSQGRAGPWASAQLILAPWRA